MKNGVKLHAFSPEIMKAAHKAAFEMYEEEAAKNPSWKKIYEPWKKFRAGRVPVAPRRPSRRSTYLPAEHANADPVESSAARESPAAAALLSFSGCLSIACVDLRGLGIVLACFAGRVPSPRRRRPARSSWRRNSSAPEPLIAPAAFETWLVTMPGNAITIATIMTWMHDERHRAPVDVAWS